jgi:phage gp29-like protein
MPLSSDLSREIASSNNDHRHHLFNNLPWTEDDTLLYLLGGESDHYDLITKDAKAKGLLENRDRNVQLREWEVIPASNKKLDRKAADVVKDVLLGCDFDQMSSDLVKDSLLKGNSFIELIWGIDGKTTFIEDAPGRSLHRFRFYKPENTEKVPKNIGIYRRHEIRLLNLSDLYVGERVPHKRFLCHCYGNKNDNPWGIGLGRVLYWFAVKFKKEIIKQRLIYLDRYAEPTKIGKAPEKASKEDRANFNRTIEKIISSGYGTLPAGYLLELLEAQRSSSGDMYQTAIDWCNKEMAMATLGETLSMELPNNAGSRAATSTQTDASSILLAKYDCDRLSTGPYRVLASWITSLNVPGAKPPMIWKLFPELKSTEDLNTRVNRDNTLNTLGYKISPEKLEEIYGKGYIDVEAVEAEKAEEEKANQFGLSFSERKTKAYHRRLNKYKYVV